MKTKIRNLSLAAALSAVSLSSSALDNNYKVWGNENISFGRGIATAIGGGHINLKAPDCIIHDGLNIPFSAGSIKLSVRSIKTSSELSRSITDKIGVTAKAANKKVETFSASFNHGEVKNSVSKSLTSVGEVKVTKDFGFSHLKNPRMNQSLLNVLNQEDPYSLYKLCGDSFAYGYRRTIELSAYIVCDANSRTSKNQLDRSFSGFGIYEGVNIGGSASRKIDELTTHATEGCRVLFNSEGGSGNIDLSSPEQFIKSSVNYAVNAGIDDAWVSEIEALSFRGLIAEDFQSLLGSQTLEFTRAQEVSEPLRLAARNIIEDYLLSETEEAKDAMSLIFSTLDRCIAEPWNFEDSCVAESGEDIDWWDVL